MALRVLDLDDPLYEDLDDDFAYNSMGEVEDENLAGSWGLGLSERSSRWFNREDNIDVLEFNLQIQQDEQDSELIHDSEYINNMYKEGVYRLW